MNIAVADEGGNIVAHVRMDGAWIGTIDISQKKAYTSRAFDIATKDLATHSQSGGQFFGIHASNNGKIMIFAGGIPLKRDGKVVGAVGVSGGSGDQDHAVAEAGAAAFSWLVSLFLYAKAPQDAPRPSRFRHAQRRFLVEHPRERFYAAHLARCHRGFAARGRGDTTACGRRCGRYRWWPGSAPPVLARYGPWWEA